RFTVGRNCARPDDGQKTCAPSVRTGRSTYAPGEPIEALFEGGPGNRLDWIGIERRAVGERHEWPRGRTPFGAPDGTWRPWAGINGALTGSHIFEGLPEGDYEIRFYARPAGPVIGEIVARGSFVVSAEQRSTELAVQDLSAGTEEAASFPPPGPDRAGEAVTLQLPPPGIEGA